MNTIAFSLFGYGKQRDDSFPFGSYLRGLSLNLRIAALIYPSWHINITIDRSTYNSMYRDFLDYHVNGNPQIHYLVVDDTEHCTMMLHRLDPVFNFADRVICRDTDSLLTYRERQAVEFWIKTGSIAHGIGDSVSHTVVLLGGMCGFMSEQFRQCIGATSFKEMVALGVGVDFSVKGADQTLLNKFILPKVAHSIVEHFPLGMPNSFRPHFYNYIQDEDISGIPIELKESNSLISHIGAAGFYETAAIKFFNKFMTKEQKDFYNKADQLFPDTFYWTRE